jgi:pyruvate dehydrogenase E2 component (dihydrolipoamide acetyltransferase)
MAEVVSMPKLGFDMAEGKLVRWLKREGEEVQKGQVLAEIETDKATVEIEAAAGGVVRKLLVAEGAAVPVGTAIAVIGTGDEAIDLAGLTGAPAPGKAAPEVAAARPATVGVPAPEAVASPLAGGRLPGGVRASPLARRMASERGVSLSALAGSGPGGRIVRKDIEAALVSPAGMPIPAAAAPATVQEPLSRLRAAIGRRMTTAKQAVPHFYITADLDVAGLLALRTQLNELLPEEQKTSVTDYIVKAAALALREFPRLNASLSGETIVRHGDINLGVAVALDEGLLTIVVHHADVKSVQAISAELRLLASRAREGKVRPEDVEGSTFTVSNLGMYDVDNFIAIINPPEAAILAVGSARDVPVLRDGMLAPGKRMHVTLSADHRVTDGAEAARWLQVFRGLIEHPLRLIL